MIVYCINRARILALFYAYRASRALLALLLFADVPVSIVAGLWNGLRAQFDPHSYSLWMVWSRFLTGGGGLALACVFAASIIGGTQRIAGRWTGHPDPLAAA